MLIAFDLDDTLFQEVDFLKSAQRHIARELSAKYGCDLQGLLAQIEGPGNVFDRMEAWLRANVPSATEDAPWMVMSYRTHHPTDLELAPEVVSSLHQLKDAGHVLALVTDGRSGTQRSKIDALGLGRWFAPDLIFISDELKVDKTTGYAVGLLDERFEGMPKMYVGDNPAKDFYWPNRKGWATVMLRDRGVNIHSQAVAVDQCYQAKIAIDSLSELPPIAATYH